MSHEQSIAVERTLATLSTLDKWALVERLVRELQPPAADDPPGDPGEAQFLQQLLRSGLMLDLPTPPGPTPRPECPAVTLAGEPLSETIIRERR